MRIAYLSIDEVNSTLAVEMAQPNGIDLCLIEPRDDPAAPDHDAVLCDWDFWPVGSWSQRLAQLLAFARCRPVALHGYGLEDDEALALRQAGVALYRALTQEVFQHLRQAVVAARVAAAAGQAQGVQRAEGAA